MKNLFLLFILTILFISTPLVSKASAVVAKELEVNQENSLLDLSREKSVQIDEAADAHSASHESVEASKGEAINSATDEKGVRIEKDAAKSESVSEKSGSVDAEKKILFKWEEEEAKDAKSKEEQKSSIDVQKSKELDAEKKSTEAAVKAEAERKESEEKLIIEKEHDKFQHRSGHDIGYSETNADKGKLKVVKDQSSSEEKGSLDASAKQDKAEIETKSSDSLKAENEKKEADVKTSDKASSVQAAEQKSIEASAASKEIETKEKSSLEASKEVKSTDQSKEKGAQFEKESSAVSGASAEREVIIRQNDRIIHLLEDLNKRLGLRAVTR